MKNLLKPRVDYLINQWRYHAYRVRSASIVLLKWIIFNVGIALIPLLFSYIFVENGTGSFHQFMAHYALKGELLILSTALIGEGISELLTTSIASKFIRVSVGGISTLALIAACLLYSNIIGNLNPEYPTNSLSEPSPQKLEKQQENKKIETTSNLIFFTALVAGAACKVIAALESDSSRSTSASTIPIQGGQSSGTNTNKSSN